MALRLASLVLLTTALAGCGASSRTVTTSTITPCGPAYVLTVDGRTFTSGGCAGIIPSSPVIVRVARGASFVIQIGHEESGALHFPVPTPTARLSDSHGTTVTRLCTAPSALA